MFTPVVGWLYGLGYYVFTTEVLGCTPVMYSTSPPYFWLYNILIGPISVSITDVILLSL